MQIDKLVSKRFNVLCRSSGRPLVSLLQLILYSIIISGCISQSAGQKLANNGILLMHAYADELSNMQRIIDGQADAETINNLLNGAGSVQDAKVEESRHIITHYSALLENLMTVYIGFKDLIEAKDDSDIKSAEERLATLLFDCACRLQTKTQEGYEAARMAPIECAKSIWRDRWQSMGVSQDKKKQFASAQVRLLLAETISKMKDDKENMDKSLRTAMDKRANLARTLTAQGVLPDFTAIVNELMAPIGIVWPKFSSTNLPLLSSSTSLPLPSSKPSTILDPLTRSIADKNPALLKESTEKIMERRIKYLEQRQNLNYAKLQLAFEELKKQHSFQVQIFHTEVYRQ